MFSLHRWGVKRNDGNLARPVQKPPTKLSEAVAMALLREIREQGLAPGTRLPSEPALMERFGVGRSTIREVVNGLAILGALEVRAGHGAFVREPDAGWRWTPQSLAGALARGHTADLFEAARLIEARTAWLAALRRAESDVEDLRAVVEAQAMAIAEQRSTVGVVRQFHVRLAWAARNQTLARAVEHVVGPLSNLGTALERLPGYREWELGEHRAVLMAVAAADPDGAAARMGSHLDQLLGWHGRLADD
jgi:GntR family transcriptional regulator, transcriptional repressor for pyruvate dehydrogenase complex